MNCTISCSFMKYVFVIFDFLPKSNQTVCRLTALTYFQTLIIEFLENDIHIMLQYKIAVHLYLNIIPYGTGNTNLCDILTKFVVKPREADIWEISNIHSIKM